MSNNIIRGKVSFVNHEKKYIIIEYEQSGKKKVVNGSFDEKLNADKTIRKAHRFQIGDTVSFQLKLSGRGDRMMAVDIKFLFNEALDVLINKAHTENNFTGYLKIVDAKYFVKEIESYLFFPAPFSPWQIKPTESELNEAVTFALENMDNKEKITVSLYHKKFIPEYYSAQKCFKNKMPVEAEVNKITAHGIYLNLFDNKIQTKINPDKTKEENILLNELKTGDKIKVMITYLSEMRIIIEPIINDNKD